jgi:hypothetical protein
MIKNINISSLQTIDHPIFSRYNIKVQVKRYHLIYQVIAGENVVNHNVIFSRTKS